MATASSPTVLVTGINGLIASNTVLEFIQAGYRGTRLPTETQIIPVASFPIPLSHV